jgi:hypothetical protein
MTFIPFDTIHEVLACLVTLVVTVGLIGLIFCSCGRESEWPAFLRSAVAQ